MDADDVPGGLGDDPQQVIDAVAGGHVQRRLSKAAQLGVAPPLQVSQGTGLGVEPGALDDLRRLTGVQLDMRPRLR